MKNFFATAGLYILFVSVLSVSISSCNKSGSPNPAPLFQDSVPKVFSVYLPQVHTKLVEMFSYNNQTQLASIQAYNYDSSGGSPVTDTFLISFTFTTIGLPPASYDEIFHIQGDPPAGQTEHHLLAYDGQNRVTADSITATTTNSFSTQDVQYDNRGNTTIQWLFGDPQTPGSDMVTQIDTMNVQNETILTDINYSVPDGTLNHLFTRSYSTHVNPLYNASLANSLGCLMVFNNLMDFRSKYLPTQFSDQEGTNPATTINYFWTTDATGSVVKGVGTDNSDGSVQQVYTFSY
jgi:hypothetical protein